MQLQNFGKGSVRAGRNYPFDGIADSYASAWFTATQDHSRMVKVTPPAAPAARSELTGTVPALAGIAAKTEAARPPVSNRRSAAPGQRRAGVQDATCAIE